MVAWVVAAAAGVVGALSLSPLLSSGFSLPGTDSSRVSRLVEQGFGDSTTSDYVLIVRSRRPLATGRAVAAHAVQLLPGGHVDGTERLSARTAAVLVHTTLNAAGTERFTPVLRRSLGSGVLVTGDDAVQHDVGPALTNALRVGELYVALPAALALLLLVFGTGSALLPFVMFTLLFGLSMDYEVFLVSRMREAWEETRSNQRAVVHGLSTTGRVVTAAGLIMAATFSGLMIGSIPTMQQLGFGLATAILIDITVVRGLLLPSTMALAGRWNWYLPRWAARAVFIRPG